MSNRIYNILFHTHTVSGLVISVALFVIFFAGSLSFFRDDIIAWERERPIADGSQMEADFDMILDTLEARYGDLYGRTITLRQMHQERNIMVSMDPSQDTLAADSLKRRAFTYLDTQTCEENTYHSSYTLGEFLYRLHFFAQIPYPYGYFLSGFVAFFFLFAIITGLIVHWQKIISNFFLFRPRAKLKTVWTDAHTALGVIGLPFQFIYAVTGAVLIIGTTVMLAPASSLLYGNDQDAMYRDLQDKPDPPAFQNQRAKVDLAINELAKQARSAWGPSSLSRIQIRNYRDASMQVIVEAEPKPDHAFLGEGQVIFDSSGQIIHQQDEKSAGYVVAANQSIHKLHFGNFGGYGLKIIYFVFGIITCFVIISGVLIWVEARDKKSNTPWKRNANRWVTGIFLSISLSMYPVTALTFSMIKIFKEAGDPAAHLFIYKVFFISWLVCSILFSIKRDNFFTNKYCLLLGSILGFIVPVVNGLVSGNWLWKTFNEQQLQIFVVDAFWLTVSIVTLLVFFRIRTNIQGEETGKAVARRIPKATRVRKKEFASAS